MTTFKAFLKVLNKCKAPVIMYTVFLIIFAGINLQTKNENTDFVSTKPDIVIVNEDEEVGITKSLVTYLKDNCNIPNIKEDKKSRDDALFYRDISLIIYIPKNFHEDFLAGKNPEIKIESNDNYEASLASMILTRFLNLANTYQNVYQKENVIITKLEESLSKKIDIEINSKVDVSLLSKVTYYYNFLNYSMLAGTIYVICLILYSFHNEQVKKRTMVSSADYKKQNRILLLSNCLFAFLLWIIYVILSIILCGNVILTKVGLLYILNSFVFTFCSVTIAFLISNLVHNKNAMNGIVNVIALGSSFLCGAFVPTEYLPSGVLKFAHILPSYYFINTNELIKKLESVSLFNLKPILKNMFIIILFSILFIILTNIIFKKKEKINE